MGNEACGWKSSNWVALTLSRLQAPQPPRGPKSVGGAAGPKNTPRPFNTTFKFFVQRNKIRALKMAAQAPTAELSQLSGMRRQRTNT
jgi:hypothetical protein